MEIGGDEGKRKKREWGRGGKGEEEGKEKGEKGKIQMRRGEGIDKERNGRDEIRGLEENKNNTYTQTACVVHY